MPFDVPIDVKQVDAIGVSFDKSAVSAEKFLDIVDQINGRLKETRSASGGGFSPAGPSTPSASSRGPSNVGSSVLGPRDPVQPWRGNGPRQTLAREREGLRRAQQVGDDDLTRDQAGRVARAEARVRADDRLLDDPHVIKGGRSSSLDPYDYVGPRSKLARDRAMHARAKATGDADLISDWEDRVKRSETAVKRLNNDPDQAKLDLLMTSRIGANGALYPLVGRLLKAGGSLSTAEGAASAASTLKAAGIGGAKDLGPMIQEAAKAAFPALLTIGGAALGGAALFGIAEKGAASMGAGNRAYYEMGGSPASVGAAMSLGGANAAQKALLLGDRLREGSYGSAYLRSLGIVDLGPTQVDKSTNYVRALRALHDMADGPNKVRAYRDVGLAEDEWTGDLSPQSFRRLERSRGMAGTPGERKAEAEYQASKDMAGNALDRVWRDMAAQPMKIFGDVLGDLADPRGAFSRDSFNDFFSARGLFGETVGDWWDQRHGGGTPENNPHSMSYKGKRMVGGQKGWRNVEPAPGTEARSVNGSMSGSVPAGWRGQAMEHALSDQAMHLGAWSV